jgi:hypothetical protein
MNERQQPNNQRQTENRKQKTENKNHVFSQVSLEPNPTSSTITALRRGKEGKFCECDGEAQKVAPAAISRD